MVSTSEISEQMRKIKIKLMFKNRGESVHWILLTQDSVQWCAPVDMVVNRQVTWKAVKFLTWLDYYLVTKLTKINVKEMIAKHTTCSLTCRILLATWSLLNLFLRLWKWRRYVHPKRRLKLDRLQGVISQKMILFMFIDVPYFIFG
jgi:hypothetical protein